MHHSSYSGYSGIMGIAVIAAAPVTVTSGMVIRLATAVERLERKIDALLRHPQVVLDHY